MLNFKEHKKMTLAVIAVAGISAATTTAVAGGPDASELANQQLAAKVEALAGKSDVRLRLQNVDPAAARVIGTREGGAQVKVAVGADGTRCASFSSGQEGFCASPDQVKLGHSFDIASDCSTSAGSVKVTAILPAGATSASVTDSSGTVPLKVADGVAWSTSLSAPNSGARTLVIKSATGAVIQQLAIPAELCPSIG